ncbi:M-phase-specific PLK1-interacting protein [Dermacentor albipictus]|uniref:M-phase-specific PLK1-interacting protein n=1 Tax=Dermacentor albipictus TaxID=60249 RepID=UPI0038FD09DD
MQNENSPRDKRPLFAQGVIYPSPPTSPYRSPSGGQQPTYTPKFSPRNQAHSGPPSPFSSPRFSTPVYGHHPRQPKYPRESYGSPRSPWQQQGYHGYPQRQHFSSSRRSSGSRGSSWSGSPFQSSPNRGASGGSHSYVKPSMVEDPWAELQDMLQVKQVQPCNASTNKTAEESPARTTSDVNTLQSDNSGQCTAEAGSNSSAKPQPTADENVCS